ncbi:MAG: sigma-54-dependent Fis family transcriptional regulator, partial [Myxococcota bacterium]|nr:sigma-54-dependent Fis family transcriptional regulator [Myxococcota bacterium]
MSNLAPRRMRPLGEQATVELEGLAAATFPSRSCVLTIIDGTDQGQRFHFTKRSIRIGSDPLNDLVLGEPTVSRRHAELSLHENGYQLTDLGSTNGTYVEGQRIEQTLLADRATLHFGKSGITFNMKVEVADIEPSKSPHFGDIVGSSQGLRQIFTVIEKIAPTPLHVLVTGDTGTGKELFARAIHQRSRRAQGPFIVFDCSAFPANLLESELFGHEKGSFSGAVQQHRGVFELASGGTLFLDELGEMSVDMQ